MSKYDVGYDPPPWWLIELTKVIETHWKGRRAELAARASAIVGRAKAWDTTRITKYLGGENSTLSMTWALAKAVGLPSPIVEARTMDETRALDQLCRRYDPVDEKPMRPERAEAAVQGIEAAVKAKADQRSAVTSSDERSPRGRGRRRASRGG